MPVRSRMVSTTSASLSSFTFGFGVLYTPALVMYVRFQCGTWRNSMRGYRAWTHRTHRSMCSSPGTKYMKTHTIRLNCG